MIALPYPPKNFAECKVEGWNSEYFSVQNVLKHLQRKAMGYGAPSYSSVGLYVAILAQFCRFSGKNPDDLVALPKGEIEELIHSYLDGSLAKGLSRKTVKTRRSFLLLHFRKNGFKGERALDIEVYSVPARYRKAPEHIPSSEEILRMADAALSVRDRAIILCVYTSGLRDSTMRALRYGDVNGVLKQAAQNAGMKEWHAVHPHALRKSFEEAVKRRRPDGTMMGEKDQEFLMGHILPGSKDPYYGSGVSVQGSAISFNREVANKLREEYRMVQFFPERSLVSRKETLAMF